MSIKEITTGQDSFLDIVANLVGVLIILVVVVGASATESFVSDAPVSDASELEQLEDRIRQTSLTATKLEADNRLLDQQLIDEVNTGEQLQQQRHAILVQQELFRQKIEEVKSTLGTEDLNEFQLSADLSVLKSELEQIANRRSAIEANTGPQIETIEHFPTPIARTVFSDEIHFRLSGNRISYVPMDELVDVMKSGIQVAAEKLKDAPETTETVGPIEGFRLQYTLRSGVVRESTDFGPVEKRVAQFDRFTMIPLDENGGETIGAAIETGSVFRQFVDRREPKKTTISIWVYPDSFEGFNEVKTWLRTRGFQTASWPLSGGRLISGGPKGFRTSAQ